MEKDLIEKYSSIVSSDAKISVLLVLDNKTLTPKRISQITKKRINHISTYLSQLKEIGIVVCINEEQRKGRLYRLTKLGITIIKELKKNGYSLESINYHSI